MPEYIPDNMPDIYQMKSVSDRLQNVCQIKCRIEFPNAHQIECQCQIECRNLCKIPFSGRRLDIDLKRIHFFKQINAK